MPIVRARRMTAMMTATPTLMGPPYPADRSARHRRSSAASAAPATSIIVDAGDHRRARAERLRGECGGDGEVAKAEAERGRAVVAAAQRHAGDRRRRREERRARERRRAE